MPWLSPRSSALRISSEGTFKAYGIFLSLSSRGNSRRDVKKDEVARAARGLIELWDFQRTDTDNETVNITGSVNASTGIAHLRLAIHWIRRTLQAHPILFPAVSYTATRSSYCTRRILLYTVERRPRFVTRRYVNMMMDQGVQSSSSTKPEGGQSWTDLTVERVSAVMKTRQYDYKVANHSNASLLGELHCPYHVELSHLKTTRHLFTRHQVPR
ncbi:hypothetical protein PM082_002442 [Marasmius tenuissimus]|nr:hypothetical protein PM082_002442 [Marasmius tenuissimus]